MQLKRLLPLAVLLLLFGFSLLIRADVFLHSTEEVKFSEEFRRHANNEVFKHVRYGMEVYRDNPVSTHWFAPYVGKSPYFLTNRFDPLLYVYSSFSPVMFIVPYLTLTAIHADLTFINMEIFSLLLHLVSVVVLFYLIRAMLPKRRLSDGIAILATSVYIFSTVTLQEHMSVYWAHQLLQPLYLGAILFFVKRRGLFKWWESLLVGFVLSIIAWTGAMLAGSFAIYFFCRALRDKDKASLQRGLAMIGGVGSAVVLVASQIMLVTGASLGEYLSRVSSRAETRSFKFSQLGYFVEMFVKNLALDAGAYILMAIGFVAAFLKRWKLSFNWVVVLITMFPLLESILIVEHDAVYGFGRLKFLVPVILILALGSYQFMERVKNKRRGLIILITCFAVAHLIHIFWFLELHNPHM